MFEVDAAKFKAVLLQRCLSLAAVARQAGLNVITVSQMTKRNCRVRLTTLGKIARALQIEPTVLTLKEV